MKHQMQASDFQGIEAKVDGKLLIIQLNVPKRKNALTPTMYDGITHYLKEASENPNISIVVITGSGDFYSSGNDFGAQIRNDSENSADIPDNKAKKGVDMVQYVAVIHLIICSFI